MASMARSPSPGREPAKPYPRDEFEEFKAKAAGGLNWLSHRKRLEFIAAHGTVVNNSSNNPPSRMDQRMAGRQRQRSRSLAPTQAGAIRLLMPSTSPLKEDQHSSGEEEEDFVPPDRLKHPRRFSAASVDARDVTCKHNIKVSISPPPSSLRLKHNYPWPPPTSEAETLEKEDNQTNVSDSEPENANIVELNKLMPPDLVALIANMPEKPTVTTYRRRSFSITPKGSIVNEGDFLVSRINDTVVSTSSVSSDLDASLKGSPISQLSRASSFNSGGSPVLSAASSFGETPIHRVMLMGCSGVGKTSIAHQFMTSEYIAAQNISFGKCNVDRSTKTPFEGQQ